MGLIGKLEPWKNIVDKCISFPFLFIIYLFYLFFFYRLVQLYGEREEEKEVVETLKKIINNNSNCLWATLALAHRLHALSQWEEVTFFVIIFVAVVKKKKWDFGI